MKINKIKKGIKMMKVSRKTNSTLQVRGHSSAHGRENCAAASFLISLCECAVRTVGRHCSDRRTSIKAKKKK
jgi:hypothetical protein